MNTSKTEEKVRVTVVKEVDLQTRRDDKIDGMKVTVVNEPWLPFLTSKLITFLKKPAGIATVASMIFIAGYAIGSLNQPYVYQNADSPVVSYHKFNNDDLRAAGLDLASEMRKFLLRWGVKEQQMSLQVQEKMTSTNADTHKEKLWQEYLQLSGMVLNERKLEFDNKYKQKLNDFRQELFKRLNARQENYFSIENPASPNEWRIIMEEIAGLTEEFLEP